MPSHDNELSLDDGGPLTADSHEIARIWVTDGAGSSVWINPTALSEPIEFGYLMADTLRHAAKAYSMAWDVEEADALQLMCDGLLAELREQVRDVEMIKFGKGLN